MTTAQAQELLHQRVSEAATEKSIRETLQEEHESTSRQIKKLKERQEVLASAGSNNVSANEYQMKEERDKLLVSPYRVPVDCEALLM